MQHAIFLQNQLDQESKSHRVEATSHDRIGSGGVGSGLGGNKAGLQSQFEFDGFIGGDDSYNDLSGELISIEDTYKEVSQYRKSGGNNDMLTNAAASASSPNIRAQNNATYEEMKASQHNSEVMKRSMTVIQEEDYEESALAVSHLGFNSHLGKGSPMRRIGQGLNNTTMSRSGNLHNYS